MNIHKHMEAIFVVTLAVVSAGSFALDNLPEADAARSASVTRDAAKADATADATADARTVVVRVPTLAQRA